MTKRQEIRHFINSVRRGDAQNLLADISVADALHLVSKHYNPIDAIRREAESIGFDLRQGDSLEKAVSGILDIPLKDDTSEGHFRYRRSSFSFEENSFDYPSDKQNYGHLPMRLRDNRISADFYICYAKTDTTLGWPKTQEKKSSYGERCVRLTKHLMDDGHGRVYLVLPTLAAKNIYVDATDRENSSEMTARSAFDFAVSLTKLGLRDPSSRPLDSYVAGRHYSSLTVKVDRSTQRKLSCEQVKGRGLQLLKPAEGAWERTTGADLEYLGDGIAFVILSREGNYKYGSSGWAEFKEAVANGIRSGRAEGLNL